MKRRCTKLVYSTMDEAWSAVRKVLKAREKNPSKDRAGYLRAYRCRDCGKIHIGHWKSREGLIGLIDRAVASDREKRQKHKETEE